jgi:KamA family protein
MDQSPSEPYPPSRRQGREHYFPHITNEQWNDWRWQFQHRITSLGKLSKYLPIPENEFHLRQEVVRLFRMGITPYYLSLIDADDPNDPILRQAVPLKEEYLYRAAGEEDPLAEEKLSPVPGLTHRYPDRCLMVVSNVCATYCRHCTRKRIMAEGTAPAINIDAMIDYIRRTPGIRDVVVSGGDPLCFSTIKLESILAKVRSIPHVEVIRIGTRIPVTLPQRVTDDLCTMLQRYHPLWINTHFNNPRECTPESASAIDKLLRAGIPVNNQCVLLHGVNDDVATMKSLMHALMRIRVRPYYVFQCDPVNGTEHLRTPVSKGIEIMEGLRGHTSGLCIPTFVIDSPGGGGKIPIGPEYMLTYDQKEGHATLRNFQGKIYEYHDPRPERTLVHLTVAAREDKQAKNTNRSTWVRRRRVRTQTVRTKSM